MKATATKVVCYTLAGTIVGSHLPHGFGKAGEMKAIPILAPHEYHVEQSASAQPYYGAPMINLAVGHRVTVEAAKLELEGHAPNLLLSGY